MSNFSIQKPPKRKIFGSIAEPGKQSRFAFATLIAWVVYASIAGSIFSYFYYADGQALLNSFKNSPSQIEAQELIKRSFWVNGMSFFVVMGGLTICHFFTTFYLSHKFFGPMVAIRKFVASVAEGDYEEKIHIREGDEFQELARELNVMADKIRTRHGPDRRSKNSF